VAATPEERKVLGDILDKFIKASAVAKANGLKNLRREVGTATLGGKSLTFTLSDVDARAHIGSDVAPFQLEISNENGPSTDFRPFVVPDAQVIQFGVAHFDAVKAIFQEQKAALTKAEEEKHKNEKALDDVLGAPSSPAAAVDAAAPVGKISRDEWKKKVSSVGSNRDLINSGDIAIENAKLIKIAGKPSLETAKGKYTYLLWQCTDGEIELRISTPLYRNLGLVQGEINYDGVSR